MALGTDSLMEILRSDINGLCLSNEIITERVYADIDGWYYWACDTIARHAPETEAQVMSSINAQVRMNGDLAVLRKLLQDPIYTANGFTPVGSKLHDGYIKVTRELIAARNKQYMVLQRRKSMRLMLVQSNTSKEALQ